MSIDTAESTTTRHIPVLLQEVRNVLEIQSDDTVLDGTLGGGGHALALASELSAKGTLVGFDVDADAIVRARARLHEVTATTVLIHGNFRHAREQLLQHGIDRVNVAFFDLGWSSDQLETSGRGFSFERNEPLHMTLSDIHDETTLTAFEIVNTWQEESIADILYGWGGERFSRRIARAIVTSRKESPIATTIELANIVGRAVPRRGRTNPATKTFQALRIAVNDELGALKDMLATLPEIVAPGARVAFLTFHSLEDKMVKTVFRTWYSEQHGIILTKKPMVAHDDEVARNPRSRSAKLRAFQFSV